MFTAFASPRPVLIGLMIAASSAAFSGCAPPLRLKTPVEAYHGAAASGADAIAAVTDTITVQVRYFSFSPTVSVIAWRAEEPSYGLRAWVRRDGSVVGEHQVYVSTYHHPSVTSLPWAITPFRPLRVSGVSRDIYSCYFGNSCSPYETFGASIADDFLRDKHDSIPVTFYDYRGREMVITIHQPLIAAYLATIDSVSAELRRRM